MNWFRICGDFSHYLAIITIFIKIVSSRSCKGISGRSQILFLIVFLSRYLDVFTTFISAYNTSVKIFFILSTSTNIYLTFVRYSGTISSELDNFRIEFLLGGSLLLSLIINHEMSPMEVLWTFSIYLEAVSSLPQLSLSSKVKTIEPAILLYIGALACHKLFYVLNWVHRYYNENYYDVIAFSAGTLQTLIYANFFVMYGIKKMAEVKQDAGV